MTTTTATCPGCDLPLDYDTCPSCGHKRKRAPWDKARTAPVADRLIREALERDGHQCRGLVVDGERCPATRQLTVHQLDPGPIELTTTGRLLTLCPRHRDPAR